MVLWLRWYPHSSLLAWRVPSFTEETIMQRRRLNVGTSPHHFSTFDELCVDVDLGNGVLSVCREHNIALKAAEYFEEFNQVKPRPNYGNFPGYQRSSIQILYSPLLEGLVGSPHRVQEVSTELGLNTALQKHPNSSHLYQYSLLLSFLSSELIPTVPAPPLPSVYVKICSISPSQVDICIDPLFLPHLSGTVDFHMITLY